jgi:hypothetical protein
MFNIKGASWAMKISTEFVIKTWLSRVPAGAKPALMKSYPGNGVVD